MTLHESGFSDSAVTDEDEFKLRDGHSLRQRGRGRGRGRRRQDNQKHTLATRHTTLKGGFYARFGAVSVTDFREMKCRGWRIQ